MLFLTHVLNDRVLKKACDMMRVVGWSRKRQTTGQSDQTFGWSRCLPAVGTRQMAVRGGRDVGGGGGRGEGKACAEPSDQH